MVTHDHGSTGIGGISYYAADQFPEAYRGTIFIGNVVTNRINHDQIEWHGSSPKGIEQPDFVWSEDNWFRPVDIELGPDGALYVADFYNRIIGHYEVPLTHPGRDRERGRIWRIVYRGTDGKARPGPRPTDRTQVVGRRAGRRPGPSQPGRADLGGQPARRARRTRRVDAAVRAIMTPGERRPGSESMACGSSQRLGPLDDATLTGLRRRPRSRAARPRHARCSSTGRALTGPRCRPGTGRLSDADPFVRRAAAEVLGRHPALGQHPAAARAPAVDVRRRHAPDPRRPHGAARPVEDRRRPGRGSTTLDLTERDRRDIADVATGVHSPEAAAFLLGYLQSDRRDPGELRPLRPPHRPVRRCRPDR